MARGPVRDSVEDIASYYQGSNEEGRAGIAQLEFAVTQRLLQRYLPPSARVLELGAGSGRYTEFLVKAGHTVTAVELVGALCEQNRDRLQALGKREAARVVQCDARDFLSHVAGPFDAVLVMGPLYHLVSYPEQQALMADVSKVVAPGSQVFTTHLSRVGLMGYMLARFPTWALDTPEQAAQVMKLGHLPDHPRNGAFRAYWSTPEEIRELHASSGFEVVALHSQDPCIGSMDELFNRLPAAFQQGWAELLTQVSDEPLAWGSGRSLLCVSLSSRP